MDNSLKMKKILFFFVFTFFIVGCNAQNVDNRSKDDEKKMFKKYVLCQCLYKAIPIKDTLLAKEGSAGMYAQMGNYDIEYYEKAIDFVNDYLKNADRKYKSSIDAKLAIAKCIELYESEELDKFIEDLKK